MFWLPKKLKTAARDQQTEAAADGSPSMHSRCCQQAPEGPGPLEARSASSPSAMRPRRPRRVMFPASQRRRPPRKEASDPARRWLLALSLLVFLQIYSEETHTCAELQSQRSEPRTCRPQEGDGRLDEGGGSSRAESWRCRMVDGHSEHQLQCVVA